MEWLNEPASWQRTGDVLTVSVDPGTDFWRETGYGYVRDSGHVYGELLAGDLDVSVRLRYSLGVQYDQAGVMLRADERTWLKTGVEFFEGRARLSTVLTLGRSSWMVTDLPAGTDDIVLRVSRRGDAVEVRYVIGEGPAELAALVFLPPGREVLAGVMAAAPEGPGFRVAFHDLRVTARDWSAGGGDDPAWHDDQAGWAAEAAPGWSPADGEPGWPVPETAEDAPDWPAAAGETAAPAWPVPAVADEEPGWLAPAGEQAEPGWAAGAQAEDPDWPVAGAGDGEPGWAAPAAPDEGQTDHTEDAVTAAPAPDNPVWQQPAGPEPDGDGLAGPEPEFAGDGLAGPEPDGDGLAGPEPDGTGLAGPEPAGPAAPEGNAQDSAAQDSAAQDSAAQNLAGQEPAGPEPAREEPGRQQDSHHGSWSPAPVPGHGAGRAASDGAAGVDPAADWERLAAATGPQAARWTAQTDAEVSSEWPGPPLRTAMRNGLLATDAAPGPAPAGAVDEAQTDPGLPRPRQADPAETGPGEPRPGGGVSQPGAGAAEPTVARDSAPDPAETGGSAPEPAETAPPARETRRARSKRAAAGQPTEPDAADEWISLLTAADPVEE